MSYEIRPATPDECERFVRSTWRRSFAKAEWPGMKKWQREQLDTKRARTPLGSAEMFMVRGPTGARVSSMLWLEMYAKTIQDLEFVGDSYVAALNDECLGWVNATVHQVNYVYVAPRFRRRGIGSALLAHVFERGALGAPTHLTYEGELLLNHVRREQPRPDTSSSQQRQASTHE